MKKIVGIVLLIIFIALSGYKVVTLIKYGVHEEETKVCDEVLSKIWIKKNNITIETKNEDDNDYLVNDNMKIKINGKYGEGIELTDRKFYAIDIGEKTDDTDKAIMLGKCDTILKTMDDMKNRKEYTEIADDLQKIIKEKNITNDVDVIKYLYSRKGDNIRSNIFTSIKQMKEDTLVYIFSEYYKNNQYVIGGSGITLIDGDYTGYMVSNEVNGIVNTYVAISKEEYIYEFIFRNFEETEILEALNTIVVE